MALVVRRRLNRPALALAAAVPGIEILYAIASWLTRPEPSVEPRCEQGAVRQKARIEELSALAEAAVKGMQHERREKVAARLEAEIQPKIG